MPRVFRFHVSPKLPDRLSALKELALNLRWSWDHPTIELFRSLDRDLWEETGHNPFAMLGRIDQKRYVELESDEAFLAQMDRAALDLESYLNGVGWFGRTHPNHMDLRIAYFSAEFGLTECVPNYAGGLGILAGDHLKSASDLGLPLVGVGLLYQGGYFHQYLNADGWQQETYPINDFRVLPVAPLVTADGMELVVAVDFPGRSVSAKVWKVQVGRVPLYLLDTNVPANQSDDRKITRALYGGERELRIQQEMVLGIGGVRTLRALGIDPTVCHMNEGHSAFLGMERARFAMEDYGLPYYEARQLTAAGSIFTTHTPVPAGFDVFDPDLVEKYFREPVKRLGISFDRFLEYGRQSHGKQGEPFNMAYFAARHSACCNAVSRLHCAVTRKMAQPVWPGYSLEEIPIGYVTNGIHTRSWISKEMNELLTRYLGPRWAEEHPESSVWQRIDRIPDEELWRVHQLRRERLIHYARARLVSQLQSRGAPDAETPVAQGALDPEALTIGFARRFATYKRATLFLRDVQRIEQILNRDRRPVQILVAGKAHPHDNDGKDLIRQIIHTVRDPRLRQRIVFLEDYDISVARYLVQGVDVWLNTPRRPNEASGTSGMKLLANGGLNISILDGWWDEAYTREVGWAIGHGEEYSEADQQDQIESEALYTLLENDVVPLFYDRDAAGIPRGWIAKVKASMKRLAPLFSTNRMVSEYTQKFYITTHERHLRLSADKGARVRPLVEWRKRLVENAPQIRVNAVEAPGELEFEMGATVTILASIHLGRLTPADVHVQLYYGQIDADGHILASETAEMFLCESAGADHRFEGSFECRHSGSCGVAVRVLPYHADAILPYELPWVQWAE